MREIKFRGKRIDNGEWVYGYFLYGAVLDEYVIWTDHENWVVDPETVGQYSGLNDKNGKEIFEGDILQAELYPISPSDNYVAVVEWADAGFVATKYLKANSTARGISHGMSESIGDRGEVEIIGNIYENHAMLQTA